MEPRVKLISDFIDYYDFMFDTDGILFERNSIGCSRRDAFRIMATMRLPVPRFGSLKMLSSILEYDTRVVIYHDTCAHRGEGKSIERLGQATAQLDPDTLGAAYIPQKGKPYSVRYLRIGTYLPYWFEYHSDDTWRSNCGNVDIGRINPPQRFRDFVDEQPVPLLAIDFVRSETGLWAAVDYNTSPGLKHSPIENTLAPTNIVNSIKRWYVRNRKE